MKLSPNFTLAEMTASATATSRCIVNDPDARQVEALRQLCQHILEPVRAHFGHPVRITSGFRTPALCLAVGSTVGSQHARGEAADFEITGVANHAVAEYIRDHLVFDQLILENYVVGQPNSGWIHCSFRPDRARHSVLTFARRKYFSGLIL